MSIPSYCIINRKILKTQSHQKGESNKRIRIDLGNNVFFDENNEVVHPADEQQDNPYLLDGFQNRFGHKIVREEGGRSIEIDNEEEKDNSSDEDSDTEDESYTPSDDEDDEDDTPILIENNFFDVGSDKFYKHKTNEEDEQLSDEDLIDLGELDFKEEFFMPWYVKMISSAEKSAAFDRQVKLFPGSRFSKEEFAKDIKDFIDRNSVQKSKQQKDLLEEDLLSNLIFKFFPENSQLPMDFTIHGDKREPKYLSTLCDYVENNPYEDRTIFIDICRNNCVAFVGNNRELKRCPTCNVERYSKCSRPKCQNLCYDDCVCDYGETRRGNKRLPYRSILQLFLQLLEYEFFVQLTNTVMVVPEENDSDDMKHGFTYKKNLREMKNNFEKWKLKHPNETRTNVNLLLSLFYDGVQVYKWKHSYFWPLIISVLNLPPTYRSKFCIGQFIIGLLTVKQGGAGEHLLLHCLIEELLILENGISVNTKNGKKYFLQVRLIQYLLDTPAASKLFEYEGHGSKAGCVYCGRISGKRCEEDFTDNGKIKRKDLLKKTVYIGHRFLLPLNHYLRIFGQTGTCCPNRFYPKRLIEYNLNADDFDREIIIGNLDFFVPNENAAVVTLKKSAFEKQGLCVDTIEHKRNVEEHIRDTNNPNRNFSWFNHFDKQLFDNYLYYLHCDLRPKPKSYSVHDRSRVYRQLCNVAENEKTHIQGVKKRSIMSRLPYFNFHEQFCPVNCHVISNNVKEYFDNVKGGFDARTKMVCEKTKSFPWLYRTTTCDDDGTLPWNLTKANMNTLDAHINSILVPLGYSEDFQIDNPYQQTDVLNMRGKFHVGATLMELITHWSFAPFDIVYKAFYLLFSKGLQNLMRRRKATKDENISILDNEIIENASLHEGLFPIGNQNTINHQLVHLTSGIRLFGCLSSFNSFSLERAGGIFKRLLKKGGVATEIGVMRKYDDLENKTIKLIYSQKIKTLFSNEDKKNKQLLKKLNPRALLDNLDPHLIHFTEYRIALYCRTTNLANNRSICDEDIFQFMQTCYTYILNKLRIQGFHGGELESKGTYESALFRIFYWFHGYKNKNSKIGRPEITFQGYFQEIQEMTQNFTNTDGIFDTLENKYYIIKKRKMPNNDNFQHADWEDMILVHKFFLYLRRITIYKSAYMFGLSFRSRKNINSNTLNESWSSADNIMSWAKYIDFEEFDDSSIQTSVQGSRTFNSSDKYMNLNYFFRLDFPDEVHLHGMAVANGTSRNVYKSVCIPDTQWKKPRTSSSSSSSSSSSAASAEITIHPPQPHEEVNFLEHIIVGSENISMHKRSIFVPAVYIYATKVMIIPYYYRHFDYTGITVGMNNFRTLIEDSKPYLLNKAVPFTHANEYAKCEKHEINFITMINMHPAKALDFRFNDLLLELRETKSFIDRYLFNLNLDST